jgi:hypothetical protein
MENELTVFISYSWDSKDHKDWVRKLADYLIDNGVNVILDQYDLAAGKILTYFMESAVEKADKVIIILTPGYKLKSQLDSSGAAFEYSLITAELIEVQKSNTKFIPVLRKKEEIIEGKKITSKLGFLKGVVYHDMTSDNKFASDAFNLLRLIYDEPEIKKPKLGEKPNFNNELEPDPILAVAESIANNRDLNAKKKYFLQSEEATQKVMQELGLLFQSIKEKAQDYKTKTKLFFNAEYKENRCILVIDGISLNLYYERESYQALTRSKLYVSCWNKPLFLDSSRSYPLTDVPKVIWNIIFSPNVSDELQLLWEKEDLALPTEKIREFVFSKLLEQVEKK